MAGKGKVTGAASPAVRAAAARARAGSGHTASTPKAAAPKAKPGGQGILGGFAAPKPTGKAPGAAAARQQSAGDFLNKIGANRAPKSAPAKKVAPAKPTVTKVVAPPKPKATTHSKLNVNAKGRVTGGSRTSTFDNGNGQSISTTQAIPDTRSTGSKIGSGLGSGTKAVSTKAIGASGKAMPALLLLSVTIVLLAKFRGGHVVDGTKALLGGIFLWFFLTMLALWSPALATLFAALVAVGVTMEYGPSVFGGLFSGKTTPLKKPLVSGINENVPEGAEGAIGGDIDSHPDSLPHNEGGLSDLRGLGPIGSF